MSPIEVVDPAVQSSRLEQRDAAEPGYAEVWTALNAKLTAIGGRGLWIEAVPESLSHPDGSPLDAITALLTAGELVVPENVVIAMVPGVADECHANTLRLFQAGQLRYRFRGVALSKKSHWWVEHSWGMDRRGRLIESTPDVPAYYYGCAWKSRPDSSPERQRRAEAKRERRRERRQQGLS